MHSIAVNLDYWLMSLYCFLSHYHCHKALSNLKILKLLVLVVASCPMHVHVSPLACDHVDLLALSLHIIAEAMQNTKSDLFI